MKLANVYLMHIDILLEFMEFQLHKLYQVLTIGTPHIIES